MSVDAAAAGPEAAARAARYAALERRGRALGAVAVLLGHTRDDQAETVLLGLARGSGRPLAVRHAGAGAAATRRPLLGPRRGPRPRRRAAAQGLDPWEDPHNADPAYRRVRAAPRCCRRWSAALGPGVAAALARTADLLRDDADAARRRARRRRAGRPGADGAARTPSRSPALPRRGARAGCCGCAALAAGAPAGALSAGHVDALDALVDRLARAGAGATCPGGVQARRAGGRC